MILAISLVGQVLVVLAALWFKRASDKLVDGLLAINERLLSDLCVRTQGEEQEEYRVLRKAMQELLKVHRSSFWGNL